MHRWRSASLAAALVAASLAEGCGEDEPPAAPDLFDAQRAFADVEAQVAIGPRPSGSAGSGEEVEFIVDSLREAGVEEITVQRPYANVAGTIPGSEGDAIVLGAHHDTKDGIPGFVGANDGASGVAVVLELARVLAADAPVQGPSVHVALFDAEEARGDRPLEEDGTRGSRQYVRYSQTADRSGQAVRGSPPLQEIGSMILFDLVGDCDLQIPREANSDPELYRVFALASERADGDPAPFVGTSPPVGDDHVPFIEAGVPAVDLIDFTFGPGPSPGAYWHTAEDTVDKVCAASLDAVGEAALGALPGGPGSGRSVKESSRAEGLGD